MGVKELTFAFRADIKEMRAALGVVSKGLLDVAKAQQAATAAQKDNTAALSSGLTKAASFGSVISGVRDAVNLFTSGLSTLAGVAESTFSAVANVAENALDTFGRFEETENQIRAALGATSQSAAKSLAADILKLGFDTRFTTEEIQAAALGLARLGTKQSDLKGLLQAATGVAAVTGTDLPTAAKAAQTAMNAFKLTAADTDKLMALFISAQTDGATSIEDLGNALKFVGAPARLAGQSIQDVTPALEGLIRTGQHAGSAGRALRQVFNRLALASTDAAPDKLTSALEELGLDASDVDPKIHKLNDILATFAAAGLDAASANEIFGSGFGSVIADLAEQAARTGGAASELDDYRKKLDDVAGATAKVDQTQQGFKFTTDQIRSTLHAATVQLGEWIAQETGLQTALANANTELNHFFTGLSKLKGSDLTEIGIRIFAPENLGAMFQDAVRLMGGPLKTVVGEAFDIGLRALIEGLPIAGELAGRAMLRLIPQGMIMSGHLAGNAFIMAVAGLIKANIQAVGEITAKAAALLDVTGLLGLEDKARKVTSVQIAAVEGVENAALSFKGALTTAESKLADTVVDMMIGKEFNLEASHKASKEMADRMLGKERGTGGSLVPALVKLGESLADIAKNRVGAHVAAVETEADLRARQTPDTKATLHEALAEFIRRDTGEQRKVFQGPEPAELRARENMKEAAQLEAQQRQQGALSDQAAEALIGIRDLLMRTQPGAAAAAELASDAVYAQRKLNVGMIINYNVSDRNTGLAPLSARLPFGKNSSQSNNARK